MAYIDIDLSEFDDDDLIEEVGRRVKRNRFSEAEKNQLRAHLDPKGVLLPPMSEREALQLSNLIDNMKLQSFLQSMDGFSLEEIESMLVAASHH